MGDSDDPDSIGRDPSRAAITSEREDYLKTIYKLQQRESPVRTTVLAEALGVEPASVTGIIKRLAELGLVNYVRYKGVTLSEAGEKIALEIIRHHRLIELYLIEALGYSWDEVHEEAEQLEHAISERLEERIAAALGHPDVDPHGSPIPTRNGVIESLKGQPISEMAPGTRGRVCRVEDETPELLRYLGDCGVVPGTQVQIIRIAPFGGHIEIQVGDETCLLGREVAEQVYIEPETPSNQGGAEAAN
jgi:DtxR family Mn-dependent transcriptional regulator